MRDPVVQVRQQFDRARSPIDQAAAWSDARLQEVSESRNVDRRHRTHAPDQKRSIQTRQASRQKQNRFRDLECSARRVTSADFQASDCSAYNVCTTTTETTSPAAIMPPEQTVKRKESVGLAVSCGDILVMDSEGVEVPHGEPGEIYIGGAMVVPGYFNNTQATEREFSAGYWKSGDLGIMDEKGYLRVIDRIKDVINRGGFKIYASEVENVLLEHPAIVEVAVVAKPCPVLGERVHAFVVLRVVVEEAELQRHCADLLSDYKIPETFRRLEGALPRNANGKVLKRSLREILVA